jgi:SAM-dependent methyltransferase
MEAMSDWRSFWDSAHSIYVNARHKDVHYREIADQIAAFVPSREARVLDYGCGEAIHADRVAAVAAEVLLCDAAPSVRAAIAARFAGDPRLRALSPEEVEQLPERSLDLIVSNSVTQYLTPAELDRLLAAWHRLLTGAGALIIGDVIPPDTGAVTDVLALLRYAARNGFLAAALAGLARTLLSPYRKLRARIGVTRYTEAQFADKLRAAGFTAKRLPRNMEHNSARMTFRAHPL